MASKIRTFFQEFIGKQDKKTLKEFSTPIDDTTFHEKEDSEFTNFDHRGQGSTYAQSNYNEEITLQSKPHSYVHRSQIISSRSFFIKYPQHRNIVHYYNVWAKAVKTKIPEHLCTEIPMFCKPGTENDEEPEIMENIVTFWREYRMQEMLKKSISKSYVHGTCIYYPLNLPESAKRWYSGPPWKIWSNDEATPYKWKYGHPIKWELNPSNPELNPDEFNEPNVFNSVFFDYKNTDDFNGEPYLIASWDDIIDLTFIKDAFNAFDQRLGNGFMALVVPNNTSEAEMQAYEDNIRHMRSSRGLVIRGDVDEPVQIDWFGMGSSQVNFVDHITKIEEEIALDIGFPKRWLLGDPEGAMESSGKDALQVNIKLKSLFKAWIPYIKRILLYHNIISSVNDVVIKPPFEMAISEQEKIEMDKMKTETIASKTWLTINEQRALDGYEAIDEDGANELFQPQEPSEDTPNTDENESEVNINGKTDSYQILKQIINTESVRTTADLLGVSPSTITKIRSKFEEDARPIIKTDSVKCDAIHLGNDVWEKRGIVVPVQKKYYPEYKTTYVRSFDELKDAFERPSTPKEFRIGVNEFDDHSSPIPLEIPESMAVGTVKLEKMTEKGILGVIRYDLKKADTLLGDNNWIRTKTDNGEFINTSVALRSVDVPISKNTKYETDLDLRSFIFTRKPRNATAGGL